LSITDNKNVLIACDSFKDALSAPAVCRAVEKGLKNSSSSITTLLCPLADGGEGSLDIFLFHSGGKKMETDVLDPLGRPVRACWGWSQNKKTAFIEMAQASGLELLKDQERDPFRTNTFGTGQLIQQAILKGAEKVILSIGGSATHDGGTGMALALGFRFFGLNGQALTQFPEQIEAIDHILPPENPSFLEKTAFTVLCDVDNPLTGPKGAAYTYAKQKGGSEEDLPLLDQKMAHLAGVWKKSFDLELSSIKGSGAAGGMGAGSRAFLKAELKSGIEYMLQLARIPEKIEQVDLVITGEGKIDRQTLHGKVIKGVVDLAAQHNVPVIGLCGKLEPEVVRPLGLAAAFSISMGPGSLEEALENTAANLEAMAEQVGRVLLSCKTAE
jgi:glycerate kinase